MGKRRGDTEAEEEGDLRDKGCFLDACCTLVKFFAVLATESCQTVWGGCDGFGFAAEGAGGRGEGRDVACPMPG